MISIAIEIRQPHDYFLLSAGDPDRDGRVGSDGCVEAAVVYPKVDVVEHVADIAG